MNGIVDDAGRALLRVQVRSAETANSTPLDVWIDTGFTGDLVLPQPQIDLLGFNLGLTIKAILGDGSTTQPDSYTCFLEWFGESKRIEVIANTGRFPLLGVGLLKGRELRTDYKTKSLSLR